MIYSKHFCLCSLAMFNMILQLKLGNADIQIQIWIGNVIMQAKNEVSARIALQHD